MPRRDSAVSAPGRPASALPNLTALPAVLLALCILLSLLDVSAFGLTDQDEGYYASVARGMVRTGDYMTPHFAGSVWFKKPPLLYWLMAGSMRIFGPSEFAVRLPSLLALWSILLMLTLWGNRRLGRSIGTYAALLFAISPLVMAVSRVAMMDTLLTACLTAALLSMWETARRPAFSIVCGAATGLAMLTKGPLAPALICLQTLLAYPLLRSRGLKRRYIVVAAIAAVVVPMPWYAGVYLTHGSDFFHQFIIQENLLRFAGGDTPHAVTNPLLYVLFYVGVIWLGVFPGSTALPVVSVRRGDPAAVFLCRWCWLVFALFTLAVTKLPAYIMPLFPAASLLAANSLAKGDLTERLLPMGRLLLALGALIWLAGSIYLSHLLHSPMVVLLGVGLLLSSGLAMPGVLGPNRLPGMPGRRWWQDPVPYLSLGIILVIGGFHITFRAYDVAELRPARSLALRVPRDAELLTYKMPLERPSLDFYRDGRIQDTDDPKSVLACLSRGGYCITIPEAVPAHGVRTVKRVDALRDSYVLVHR